MQQIYLEKLGKLKLHKAGMFHEKKESSWSFISVFTTQTQFMAHQMLTLFFIKRQKKLLRVKIECVFFKTIFFLHFLKVFELVLSTFSRPKRCSWHTKCWSYFPHQNTKNNLLRMKIEGVFLTKRNFLTFYGSF